MKRNLTQSAQKRVGQLAVEAAKRFDSPLVHNKVYVTVEEYDQLRQLVNVAEAANNINENYDQWQPVRDLGFAVAEDLNDYVDDIVDMAVAEACVEIVEDADDWREADYADAEIEEAVYEASRWFVAHDDVLDRLNLEVEIEDKSPKHAE